jgi:hypothetical protein
VGSGEWRVPPAAAGIRRSERTPPGQRETDSAGKGLLWGRFPELPGRLLAKEWVFKSGVLVPAQIPQQALCQAAPYAPQVAQPIVLIESFRWKSALQRALAGLEGREGDYHFCGFLFSPWIRGLSRPVEPGPSARDAAPSGPWRSPAGSAAPPFCSECLPQRREPAGAARWWRRSSRVKAAVT